MEKIPTAEDFLKDYELGNSGKVDIEDAREALLEFAKLHVEAALKVAEKSMKIGLSHKAKELFLNSYPPENIK